MLEEFSCQEGSNFQVSLSSCLMIAPVALSVTYSKQEIRDFTEELVSFTHVVNFRVDDVGPVLLHGGLDQILREAVPQEVHQSVLGGDVLLGVVGQVHIIVGAGDAVPGLDGDDQDDAENDSQDGGGDVVEDCAESNFPGERQVH